MQAGEVSFGQNEGSDTPSKGFLVAIGCSPGEVGKRYFWRKFFRPSVHYLDWHTYEWGMQTFSLEEKTGGRVSSLSRVKEAAIKQAGIMVPALLTTQQEYSLHTKE